MQVVPMVVVVIGSVAKRLFDWMTNLGVNL